jgi:hypothetical protein
MAKSTRANPEQQFEKAPDNTGVYVIASDPLTKKYQHKKLMDLGLGGGSGVIVPPTPIYDSVGVNDLVSKTFTVARPLGKAVATVFIYHNQAWAYWADYTPMHNTGTVDITVTGHNALIGDVIALQIFWD